ncbi:hypothetical protein [Butyrivibrio sp. FCS014]|uniref:hypothetical protein n=1 Tax=Butyrivibrio sp. FCS014 TaxID=1408304 RepID=UPI000463E2A2|nr:hypothetical protein [Butyrivibrio sp. FCS014]
MRAGNVKYPAGEIPTGFTIKNSQVNPLMIQEPTLFTFRTIDGSEDNATTTKIKEAFTKETYVLNPNVHHQEQLHYLLQQPGFHR